MKSGYKILWTKNALKELRETIGYLEENCIESDSIRNLLKNPYYPRLAPVLYYSKYFRIKTTLKRIVI